MLGSKGFLPPAAYGLLRISCSRNPKNIQNPPDRATFSCFFGSQSHVLACKHVIHDLLTLASYYLFASFLARCAFAPLHTSVISWVIAACLARLYLIFSSRSSSSALLVAASMAAILALCTV